jgi:hypothetical protein
MLDINLGIGLTMGDGRAINSTEVNITMNHTLQLKGAGPTPYSRKQMVLRFCALPLENIYVPKPCII